MIKEIMPWRQMAYLSEKGSGREDKTKGEQIIKSPGIDRKSLWANPLIPHMGQLLFVY
jgi:hypothetical protein